MKRRYIYYFLTAVVAMSSIGGALNSQFILVSKNQPWYGRFAWELLFTGFGYFLYTLGCLFLSFLSDKYGRLRCISFSLLIIALMNAILGLKLFGTYKLWNFFLYWGIVNLCNSVFFTGVEGILSEYQDHSVSLARRLGAYCLSWCIADVVSAFITGNTKQIYGPEIIYYGLFYICFVAFLVALWDWFKHGDKKLGEIEIGIADIRPEAPFFARLGRIGLFFGSLAYMSLSPILPRFGRDFHGLSEAQIGNLISMILLFSSFGFIFIAHWKRWHYNLNLQILLQIPMALGLCLVILAPAKVFGILKMGFVLFGFGWACTYFFSIYYSLTVVENHAKSGGIHESFLGFGNLSGPFASVGLIWLLSKTTIFSHERIGVIAVIFGMTGVIISLLVQLYLIYRYKHSKNV